MPTTGTRSSRTTKTSPKADRKASAKKPTPVKKATAAKPTARTSSAKSAPAAARKTKNVKAPAAPAKGKATRAGTAESETKKRVIEAAESKKSKRAGAEKPAAVSKRGRPAKSETTAAPVKVESAPLKGGRKKTEAAPVLPPVYVPRKKKAAEKAPEPVISEEVAMDEEEATLVVPGESLFEEELAIVEDEIILPEDIELDPLEIPLELLDPELVDVPRPTAPPKPKPKLPRVDRRPQQCGGCGQTFAWLSVDQLCFNCLKRKLSQRKREDESYSGFTPEAEEEDDS